MTENGKKFNDEDSFNCPHPSKVKIEQNYNHKVFDPPVVIYETKTTRIIIRFKIGESKSSDYTLKMDLVAQRKTSSGNWDDCKPLSRSRLKAGEELKWIFDSKMTKNFLNAREIHEKITNDLFQNYGDKQQVEEYFVINVTNKEDLLKFLNDNLNDISTIIKEKGEDSIKIINSLLSTFEDEDLISLMEDMSLDKKQILEKIILNQNRKKALEVFNEQLESGKWLENHWKEFFMKNSWILGCGIIDNTILEIKGEEIITEIVGPGNVHKIDILCGRYGVCSNPIIVELKTPNTRLFNEKEYDKRRNIYPISHALAGAISQISSYRMEVGRNLNTLNMKKFVTEVNNLTNTHPDAILVIGDTKQFEKNELFETKKDLFNAVRNSIKGITIRTFDEVYSSAEAFYKEFEKS